MLQSLIEENERANRLSADVISAHRTGDLRTYMKEYLYNVRAQHKKDGDDARGDDDVEQSQESNSELGTDAATSV